MMQMKRGREFWTRTEKVVSFPIAYTLFAGYLAALYQEKS
jgi:hypothetical protein